MKIAIIVIACLVAAAVIGFFVWYFVRRYLVIKKIEAETGEKYERRTFKEWLIAHKPSKRKLIQVYAALLYNANIKGYISGSIYKSETTKYMCVPGLNCYSCPGAVGACPLGAFQNALAESSVRAPYYVLGILGIFGLMLARTICGFLCPVGLGQELLYKIRTPKLKKNRVTRVLSYFKYVLLVGLAIIIPLMYALRDVPLPGFCKYVCPAGTLGGAIGLLINPNNADMFGMLGGQFAWKFSLLVVFIVGSIFIFRFFCRFFCPLGAIYGFFNKIALIGVKVEKDNCTDCGKCVAVCKMDIKRVGDHECINCGECIPVCPTKAISWKGSKIFLHKSAIDDTPVLKPLDVTGGAIAINAETPQPETVKQTTYSESVTIAQADTPAFTEIDTTETTAGDDGQTTVKRKRKDKKFWLQLVTIITALAVLVGALVYYNFIDVTPSLAPPDDTEAPVYVFEVADTENTDVIVGEYVFENKTLTVKEDGTYELFDGIANLNGTWIKLEADTYAFKEHRKLMDVPYKVERDLQKGTLAFYDVIGNEVGMTAPDFTIAMYGSDESFNLKDKRGKLTVINFWATWCTPCVAEIPYFDELVKNHPEINVIAIHGSSTRDVDKFIADNWPQHVLQFAQDNLDGKTCLTYELLGGAGMWPMTVIVDEDGKVLYNSTKSFHSYDDLEQLVNGFLTLTAE